MNEQQDNRNEREYQYNDEMTIVQNFFQKHAETAQFIRSSFPDQIDFLDDNDPNTLFTADGSADYTEDWSEHETEAAVEVGSADADLLAVDGDEADVVAVDHGDTKVVVEDHGSTETVAVHNGEETVTVVDTENR